MISYKGYESVNGVPFGASKEEVIRSFGNPNMETLDNSGNRILMYDDFSVSLDKESKFFYFSVCPGSEVRINGSPVSWKFDGIRKFIEIDGNPREDSGFLILKNLGVAFVDFHNSEDGDMSDKVIVFFRKGGFDSPTEYEKPFNLEKPKRNK